MDSLLAKGSSSAAPAASASWCPGEAAATEASRWGSVAGTGPAPEPVAACWAGKSGAGSLSAPLSRLG